jgi:hypothetical protein
MIPPPWIILRASISPRNIEPPLARYWLAPFGSISERVAIIHPIKSEKPHAVNSGAVSLPLGFNFEHMNKLHSRLQYEKAKEAFFMRLLLLSIILAILTFQLL